MGYISTKKETNHLWKLYDSTPEATDIFKKLLGKDSETSSLEDDYTYQNSGGNEKRNIRLKNIRSLILAHPSVRCSMVR